MIRTAALIVAAGAGTRFGGAKQFVPLNGTADCRLELRGVSVHPGVDGIVLVLPDAAGGTVSPAVPQDDRCRRGRRAPSGFRPGRV